jgi:hypothetical protein
MLVITYNEDIVTQLANGVFTSETNFTNFLNQQNPEEFLVLNGFNTNLTGLNKKFVSFTHTHGVTEGGSNANQIELVLNESQVAFPLEKFLIQGYSKEVYRKYKKQVDALGGAGLPLFDKTKVYNTPYLYVLYSSKSSFSDYKDDISGPHKCTIAGINVKANESQYLDYNITLSPIAKEIGDSGFIRLATKGSQVKPIQIKRQGSSKLINLNSKVDPSNTDEIYPTKNRLGPLGSYNSTIPIDFHLIVKDLIRDYLRSLAGPSHKNVIVLLPNINQVCADKIAKNYEDSVYGYRNQSVDSNVPFIRALQEAQEDEASYSVSDKALRQYYVLRSFAEQLGVDIVEVNTQPPTENVTQFAGPIGSGSVTRTVPMAPKKLEGYYKNAIGDNENTVNFNDKALDYFTNIRYKFVLDDVQYSDDDGMVTYNEFGDKLKNFLSKINSLAGLDFQWKMYTETNTTFTNLIKDPEFNGSDLLGTDNPNPGDENIIIFGERNLVNNYLYGLGDITAFTNKEFLHPVDDQILKSGKFVQKKSTAFSNVNFFPIFTTQSSTDNKTRSNNFYKISKFDINENATYRNALDTISGKLLNQVQYLGITVPQVLQNILGSDIVSPPNPTELIELLEPVYEYYSGDIEKINQFFDDTIDELSNLAVNIGQGIEFKNKETNLKTLVTACLLHIQSKNKTTGSNNLLFTFEDNLLIDEAEFQTRLANQFNELQLSISLTTTMPAFRLGSFYLIGKEAKFEAIPPGGKSRLLELPKNYYILGYTHKMTGTSMESQFELVRKR